jgi:hypothetical protein
LIAAYERFDTPGDDNVFAVYTAVACTDAHWPQKWSTWERDYWHAYRVARFAAWNSAWYNGPCLYWSVPAASPVKVKGDHVSALLIDETLDAATPFEGSLEVRKRFPQSSLIAEPGGTTHAGTLFGNECVDGHIADYLATGALPTRLRGRRADAQCAPFPQPVPTGAASSATPSTAAARLALQRPALTHR